MNGFWIWKFLSLFLVQPRFLLWIFLLIILEYFFHEKWLNYLFQEVPKKKSFYRYKQVSKHVHAAGLFDY